MPPFTGRGFTSERHSGQNGCAWNGHTGFSPGGFLFESCMWGQVATPMRTVCGPCQVEPWLGGFQTFPGSTRKLPVPCRALRRAETLSRWPHVGLLLPQGESLTRLSLLVGVPGFVLCLARPRGCRPPPALDRSVFMAGPAGAPTPWLRGPEPVEPVGCSPRGTTGQAGASECDVLPRTRPRTEVRMGRADGGLHPKGARLRRLVPCPAPGAARSLL